MQKMCTERYLFYKNLNVSFYNNKFFSIYLKGFYDSNNYNGGENSLSKKTQSELNETMPIKKKIGMF